MEEKKPFAKRDVNITIIATLSLLCIVIVFACFRYYDTLQDAVKSESGSYLQEISKQISANAGKTIDDNFTILGTIATVLKSSDISTVERLSSVVAQQEQHWGFKSILLVDADGVSHDANGREILLGSDAYLRDAIVGRKRAMSTSQMLESTECVVFAIPIDGISVDGKNMSALIATFDSSTFDKMLSITAFDGMGYGHIIRRDGTVVIRSSSSSAAQTGYNILSSLSKATFSKNSSAEPIKADIANGVAGQAELTLDGVPLYMAYTPLETQEWCLLTFIPVAIANAKTTHFFKITLLLCLVIAISFCILLAVIMYISYRHKRGLETLAYVDPITGGNTAQSFYMLADGLLSASNSPQYALVYTNIAKFKVLNEQLGRAACDTILRTASNSIQKTLSSKECSGRLFADNFCVLIEYKGEENLKERMLSWGSNYNAAWREFGTSWLPLSIELGIYVVEDTAMSLPAMVDRAKLALHEPMSELDTQLHYTIYDERMRRRLLREKQLEDMMAIALEKHEFQVYLQPKYCTGNKNIGGAEALVRWSSASEGMIYPDEFISLFERNGFIVRLDLWVFEQVCKTLASWLSDGRTPMRISVNCSRIHLKTPGFLEQYRAILEKYAIPPNLLEIELTENVVFEDVVHLTKTIAEIHALGLSCSMDDFGSGYSSLNLIRDIPVDVLKIDKIFFCSSSENPRRTESVVGSIIAMARALSMETVAEGVEESSQVEMLERLGCDFIQGYYFAKPMPIADFEKLAFKQN